MQRAARRRHAVGPPPPPPRPGLLHAPPDHLLARPLHQPAADRLPPLQPPRVAQVLPLPVEVTLHLVQRPPLGRRPHLPPRGPRPLGQRRPAARQQRRPRLLQPGPRLGRPLAARPPGAPRRDRCPKPPPRRAAARPPGSRSTPPRRPAHSPPPRRGCPAGPPSGGRAGRSVPPSRCRRTARGRAAPAAAGCP